MTNPLLGWTVLIGITLAICGGFVLCVYLGGKFADYLFARRTNLVMRILGDYKIWCLISALTMCATIGGAYNNWLLLLFFPMCFGLGAVSTLEDLQTPKPKKKQPKPCENCGLVPSA